MSVEYFSVRDIFILAGAHKACGHMLYVLLILGMWVYALCAPDTRYVGICFMCS